MDVEYVKEADEVAQALLVANALEKSSKTIKGTNFQDIEDGLRELDMDNYDEEDDDGILYLSFSFIVLIQFLKSFEICIRCRLFFYCYLKT